MMIPLIALSVWFVASTILIAWCVGVTQTVAIASEAFHSFPSMVHHFTHPNAASQQSPLPQLRDGTSNVGFDPEYPFNNVVNSFFPVDALIEYNTTTAAGSLETHLLLGRYASFSNIIEASISSHYKIFPNNGCTSPINKTIDTPADYSDKILVLQRGECTFVDKVKNVLDAGLSPRAVIIGNNEPSSGLVTMYSGTFNSDGAIRTPILFITYEDYVKLEREEHRSSIRAASSGDGAGAGAGAGASHESPLLTLRTASIGSWLNLVLSMALSPPLLILSFYALIKLGQSFRKKQKSKNNVRLVNSLPVYVYNVNHLIWEDEFKEYLKLTKQQEYVQELLAVANGGAGGDGSAISSAAQSIIENIPHSPSVGPPSFVVNGVDLKAKSFTKALHRSWGRSENAPSAPILFSPEDYYPAYKCSICLDHFKPLQSRILVLDCKHFYHQACLSNWLINFRKSCPLCNTAFRSHHGLLEHQALLGEGAAPGGAGIANFGTFDLEAQRDMSATSSLRAELQDDLESETESHGPGRDVEMPLDEDLEVVAPEPVHAPPPPSSANAAPAEPAASQHAESNSSSEVGASAVAPTTSSLVESAGSTAATAWAPAATQARLPTSSRPKIDGTPSFVSHDTDNVSFYSANSELSSTLAQAPPAAPPPPASRGASSNTLKKYQIYHRPSQILSQYAGEPGCSKDLSSSIDEDVFADDSKEVAISHADISGAVQADENANDTTNDTDVPSIHSDLTIDGYNSAGHMED